MSLYTCIFRKLRGCVFNALEAGVSVGSRYILVSEVLVKTTLGSTLHPSEPTQKCQAWWSALVISGAGTSWQANLTESVSAKSN